VTVTQPVVIDASVTCTAPLIVPKLSELLANQEASRAPVVVLRLIPAVGAPITSVRGVRSLPNVIANLASTTLLIVGLKGGSVP